MSKNTSAWPIFFLAALLCFAANSRSHAAEAPLEVLYFQRPPFYFQRAGKPPGGILLELMRSLLNKAQTPHIFTVKPNKRILGYIERGGNYCSIGWYKTTNRQKYAHFSKPIYRDMPLVLLANQAKAAALPRNPTLAQALNSGLRLGMIAGFSYGQWADEKIKRLRPKREVVTTEQKNLIKMLQLGRCDLVLMGLEEANWVMRNYQDMAKALMVIRIKDAPPGNLRYIIYSREVKPSIIDRIDSLID
jgi:polar amino acid transport system substrate-binding protein